MVRFMFKIVIFLFIAISVTTCDKQEETGTLNLKFQLVYGKENLEMFKEYNYPDTQQKLFFSRISFFLSELKIIGKEGSFVLNDVDYLNLTASHTAPITSSGFDFKIDGILAREYTSLNFGIGVPASLNSQAPADFKPEQVLSSAAEYWSAWKSYIFFRPEGTIKLDGDTSSGTNFALHLGADPSYINFEKSVSFKIEGNKETEVLIKIDMEKFFKSKTRYDIEDTQQIHSLSQSDLVKQLTENLKLAIN